MGGILALDIATFLGWANWPGPGGGKITFGSHRIAPSGAADREWAGRYMAWLDDMITVMAPRAIAYEAPLLRQDGKTNQQTILRLVGAALITEAMAEQRAVPRIIKANLQSVKKFWTGAGRVDKAQMMQFARIQGFPVTDDNQADALAVLHWAKHELVDMPARLRGAA